MAVGALSYPIRGVNRAGSGGNIALRSRRSAVAGRHTLLSSALNNAISLRSTQELPFDFIRDTMPSQAMRLSQHAGVSNACRSKPPS